MGATAAVGIGISALNKVYAGNAAKASADSTAMQFHQEAGQSVASGIQASINERRRADYVASTAQARAAASGGGATDPTVVNIVSQLKGEGEYRAMTALYEGQDRGTQLDAQASATRREGKAARTAGWISGISTVLSGGTSLYDKYSGA